MRRTRGSQSLVGTDLLLPKSRPPRTRRKGVSMRRVIVVAAMGALLLGAFAPGVSAQPGNFRAVLSGGDEVPVRDTRARGLAMFMLSADGTELIYQINVANIENVVAAHIHCGEPGVAGPVGVSLFGDIPGGAGSTACSSAAA